MHTECIELHNWGCWQKETLLQSTTNILKNKGTMYEVDNLNAVGIATTMLNMNLEIP